MRQCLALLTAALALTGTAAHASFTAHVSVPHFSAPHISAPHVATPHVSAPVVSRPVVITRPAPVIVRAAPARPAPVAVHPAMPITHPLHPLHRTIFGPRPLDYCDPRERARIPGREAECRDRGRDW